MKTTELHALERACAIAYDKRMSEDARMAAQLIVERIAQMVPGLDREAFLFACGKDSREAERADCYRQTMTEACAIVRARETMR